MKEENKKKPVNSYKAGLINLNIWENETNEGKVKSITISRAYKDKEENWQHTSSLRISDLPKLMLLLNKAYEDNVILR
jgi:hypothetical protein